MMSKIRGASIGDVRLGSQLGVPDIKFIFDNYEADMEGTRDFAKSLLKHEFKLAVVPLYALELAEFREFWLGGIDMSMAGDSKSSAYPIILDKDYSVIDGMHRIATAIRDGKKEMLAWVLLEEEKHSNPSQINAGDLVLITDRQHWDFGGWGIVLSVLAGQYHVGMYGGRDAILVFDRDQIRKQKSKPAQNPKPNTEFTAAFWRWFGNSKIVDSQGNPLLVYHGTARVFKTFDERYIGSVFEASDINGFYFTTSKNNAWGYAYEAEQTLLSQQEEEDFDPTVIEAYLRIERPLVVQVPDSFTEEPSIYLDENRDDLMAKVRRYKYDGIVVMGKEFLFEGTIPMSTLVVFDTEQIRVRKKT